MVGNSLGRQTIAQVSLSYHAAVGGIFFERGSREGTPRFTFRDFRSRNVKPGVVTTHMQGNMARSDNLPLHVSRDHPGLRFAT